MTGQVILLETRQVNLARRQGDRKGVGNKYLDLFLLLLSNLLMVPPRGLTKSEPRARSLGDAAQRHQLPRARSRAENGSEGPTEKNTRSQWLVRMQSKFNSFCYLHIHLFLSQFEEVLYNFI